MRNNETGEFELVVGNRQLLSGFFIVVLLFAVAFAMGYVVGQNSPRSAKAAGRTREPAGWRRRRRRGRSRRPARLPAPATPAARAAADARPARPRTRLPQPTTAAGRATPAQPAHRPRRRAPAAATPPPAPQAAGAGAPAGHLSGR